MLELNIEKLGAKYLESKLVCLGLAKMGLDKWDLLEAAASQPARLGAAAAEAL